MTLQKLIGALLQPIAALLPGRVLNARISVKRNLITDTKNAIYFDGAKISAILSDEEIGYLCGKAMLKQLCSDSHLARTRAADALVRDIEEVLSTDARTRKILDWSQDPIRRFA